MSVDPRFERSVLAELALEGRRARQRSGSLGARTLAESLHRGRHDLLAHLRWVAYAVPGPFRAVARLIRTLPNAPGMAGDLARVVARAAIEDRLDGPRPTGETLTALRLLPDPRLTR